MPFRSKRSLDQSVRITAKDESGSTCAKEDRTMISIAWWKMLARIRRSLYSRPIRKGPRRPFRPGIELLEDRVVPTVNSWINASGGSWNDAANWSRGAVPGSADDVTINVSGNVTVHLSSGSTSVNSLQVANSLVIDGGSLTSANVVQVTGTLSLQSGALSTAYGAYAIVNGGTFDFSGGSISGPLVNLNSTLDIASTVTSTTTIEVRGGSNTFVENASTAVTVKVEGDTWGDGVGVLTAVNGATNAGTITLGGWANSELALAGTLTNTGIISTSYDSDGSRYILGGTLYNQGTVATGRGAR